jgi:endonuclease YncB( thermonuclease family)
MKQTHHIRTVLLVVVILFAGCTGVTDSPATTESPVPESTATPSPTTISTTSTASPTSTQTSSESPTPSGPQEGDEWAVTITRVIDGDTVEARFPNGEIDTLRLLGVDTPETTLNRVSPEEFEGIPDTTAGRDHLFNWGEKATAFATSTLQDETVRIAVDPEADRRGSFGRLLVYIYVGEANFNKQLLTDGYARMYDSQFSKRAEFLDAEKTARENQVGLWKFDGPTPTPTATPESGESDLAVWNIHEDADGNDHENLNDEYIEFKNTGDQSLDLTGWTVSDDADHTYHFPEGFVLESGSVVTLRTGSGSDTQTELYWGSGSAIWNNGGDTITVADETGSIVIEEEY